MGDRRRIGCDAKLAGNALRTSPTTKTYCISSGGEGAGRWALGAGRWALGAGRWALGAGAWVRSVSSADRGDVFLLYGCPSCRDGPLVTNPAGVSARRAASPAALRATEPHTTTQKATTTRTDVQGWLPSGGTRIRGTRAIRDASKRADAACVPLAGTRERWKNSRAPGPLKPPSYGSQSVRV